MLTILLLAQWPLLVQVGWGSPYIGNVGVCIKTCLVPFRVLL